MSNRLKEALLFWSLVFVSILACLFVLRVVWLSGFDQGVDVTLCVTDYFYNGEVYNPDDPACMRAKEYESHPFWQFRRR